METSGDEATAGMNTGRFLTKAATQRPAADAIRYLDRTISYADFSERSRRLGGAFLDLGLRHGDRVAILQHNCPEYLETLYGGFMAGLVAVPINMRLHPKEIAYIANDSGAKIVVHEPSRDAASTKMGP